MSKAFAKCVMTLIAIVWNTFCTTYEQKSTVRMTMQVCSDVQDMSQAFICLSRNLVLDASVAEIDKFIDY